MSQDAYEGPPRANSNNSGCVRWVGFAILIALGAIVGVLLLVAAGLWTAGDRFTTGLETMFNGPTPTPTVDIRNIVVRQIRDASELTTTVYAMETVVEASATNVIAGIEVGTTRLLLIAYGEVRGGIDLSEITVEDITVTTDTIQIQLPPPRIIDSKIDVDKTRVYDYDRGFLNLGPDAPDLQGLAQQEALQKVRASACENAILEEANQRAELVVEGLFSGLAEGRRVVVVTQPSPECS